jgi:plasmid stabilization system protein ParE
MKYRVSKLASRDLEAIWKYVAEHANIDTAEKVDSELHSAMKNLAAMPGIGHEREETRGKPYRFWKVYSYLIVYRMDRANLIVLRVIHGARDLKRIFGRS